MSKVFERIDWVLLREQKERLVALPWDLRDADLHSLTDAMDGIVHLIDHIQDCAAEELGEDIVFGRPEE